MKVIIKFIFNSIREKKFRTFLILFAIVMSTALFFASTALSTTMEKMFIDKLKQDIGEAEIIIHPSEESSSPFMYIQHVKNDEKSFEYAVGTLQAQGEYEIDKEEKVNLSMEGIEYEDLKKSRPISLASEQNLLPFQGNKIIVSKSTAEKYKWKLGETIKLNIGENEKKFVIVGIANPTGMFLENGQTIKSIVPLDTLSKIQNARGKVTQILIKLKNPEEKEVMIERLSKDYPQFTVRETFSVDEIRSYTSQSTTTFNIMLLVVLFMSTFIIYTSFKVISIERTPIIGTFRSVGGTKKLTNGVLLLESLVYGVLGGILGCILGIGFLYVMSMYTRPVWMEGLEVTVSFKFSQMIIAFILAILLSVGSSLIPVIQISNIPLKEIVLNTIETKVKKGNKRTYFGFFFLFLILFTTPYIPSNLMIIVISVYLILSMVSIILLLPLFTSLIMGMMESIYGYIFGNIGEIAVKNLRKNKSVQNNITLITIGVSSLFMITTVSSSLFEELGSFYSKNMQYEISMYAEESDRALLQKLRSIDNIKGVFGLYEARGIEIEGRDRKIYSIHGINPEYFNFIKFEIEGDRKKILSELEQGRNIILANTIKEALGVEIGDTLTLNMPKGKKEYKVIGVTTAMYNGGYFGMVSEKYVKLDTNSVYYNEIMVQTEGNASEVKKEIKDKLGKRIGYIEEIAEWEKIDRESNEQLFSVLNSFSIMALIIGIVGVFNNFIINFLQRKRAVAIYRSVGMEVKQVRKMFLIESLTGGMVGGILGVMGGIVQLYLVPYILIAVQAPKLTMVYSMEKISLFIFSGIFITILASVGPSFKSSNRHIIESIKYE